MIDYNSVTQVKEILELFSFSMKKRFGQNFLIDKNIREKILNELDYSWETECWEIGPGIGSITHILFHKLKNFKVFEIDKGFINFLKNDFKGIEIIEGDFIKTFKPAMEKFSPPKRVVGNLPYCAAANMIFTIIESPIKIDKMVFTIQKEVAQRMVAKPGSKNYSSWTLACNLKYNTKLVGDIGKSSFFPQPNVQSSIVVMEPHNKFGTIDEKLFFSLVKTIFSSRRKTIKNNILNSCHLQNYSHADIITAFEKEDIKITDRGETLSVEQLVNITKNLLK